MKVKIGCSIVLLILGIVGFVAQQWLLGAIAIVCSVGMFVKDSE